MMLFMKLQGQMRILEREGLNGSYEKTKDFMERAETEFLNMRGVEVNFFQNLGQSWPTKLPTTHPITEFDYRRLEGVG